ncbi:hypothetical protein PVAR5_7732 [Paecilomyces variotii No. 5]|uniref:Uncharacterized protein n=1 Tax=Byssochlamys spectabilis (strain No. 5 / NBRC 109023) TaxID=1356009 RepID=V5GDM4_BYSSN|nr:hypothetical protein PVAR5_7732 [Paecilomyces variotii No. 5]
MIRIEADACKACSDRRAAGSLTHSHHSFASRQLSLLPAAGPVTGSSRARSRTLLLTAAIFGTGHQPLPPLAFRPPSQPTLSVCAYLVVFRSLHLLSPVVRSPSGLAEWLAFPGGAGASRLALCALSSRPRLSALLRIPTRLARLGSRLSLET